MPTLYFNIPVLLSLLASLDPTAAKYNTSYPQENLNTTFFSRPDLIVPKWLFPLNNTSAGTSITPGYILLAPSFKSSGSTGSPGVDGSSSDNSTNIPLGGIQAAQQNIVQSAPYIFDYSGNLIYTGFGMLGESADVVKLAQYNGKTHMTAWKGSSQTAGNRGQGVIIDESYHTIQTVESGLGRASNDAHEFTVLDDGTAITTIFQPTPYNLAPYGVNQSVGWIIQGIAQRIDIATGRVLFEWASLDHTSPTESYNALNGNLGTKDNGVSITQGWDYFHMNSIQVDDLNNYLISSRYLSTLFYINGSDGTIIWRLNGKKSDFTFHNFNKTFAFQHHARIRQQNATHMTISLFDNSSDGFNTTNRFSSGMLMSLDLSARTCTLLHSYVLPDGGVLTLQTGSVQPLSDGNVFVGWGTNPYVSEHAADGTPLWIGQFGSSAGLVGSLASSYRAYKLGVNEWQGMPDKGSMPALFVYANGTEKGPTTFWTSWNGATNVTGWRFFAAGAAGGGNASVTSGEGCGNGSGVAIGQGGTLLGEVRKSGFETAFKVEQYVNSGYVEAVDGDGNVLGTSVVKATYVPPLKETDGGGLGQVFSA